MNLNYKIYLIDNNQYAELDTEGLDFTTIFSISDVKDISAKKDTLSKNITLAGTKNNNKVFGSLFSPSRYVDASIEQNLFVNFSVNKTVECLVLENSTPILKGYLKFVSATIENGKISYECIITGNIFNFFSLLGDKLLSDLDFTEYEHQYNITNIYDNWHGGMYVDGSLTDAESGKGYVYPFINYGDVSSPHQSDINKIHINNFRPAIYVQEYLKKIFNQPELSGFTYEVIGTDDFVDDFKHLIIPNDAESFNQTAVGNTLVEIKQTGTIDSLNAPIAGFTYNKALNFNTITDTRNFLSANTDEFYSHTNNIFQWDRDVTADVKVTFDITLTNNNDNSIQCYLRFLERDNVSPGDVSYSSFNNFSTINEIPIENVGGNSTVTKSISMVVPQRTFQKGRQTAICIFATATGVSFSSSNFNFSITNAIVVLPSVPNNLITYSVEPGDMVKPMPVSNIKQKDFIKSLTLLFNLYAYSSLFNPKHVVFQPYDDYYKYCLPENIQSTALDYTYKIDYSDKVVFSSYGELAKKYSFTYKADNDYYNNLYTSKYAEIFGNYSETDSLGINDEKKVELIFSPTPLVQYNNTGRINPEIFKLDSGNFRATTKSNIRILYYNGLKQCEGYQVGKMTRNGNDFSFEAQVPIGFPSDYSFTYYAQSGHIRFADGFTNLTYKADLNFGIGAEYFFPADLTQLENIPNSYTGFYSNQIKELTDLNNVLLETNVLLNEADISNLDLRVPIFINNQYGNAYYKVLEVEYSNRFETSTVKLQKINI